jgi:hypothetical protein
LASSTPRGKRRLPACSEFQRGISANERERRLAGLRERAQGRRKLMPGKMLARISNAGGEIRIDSITRRRREPVNVIVNCTQQQTKHFVFFLVFVRAQGQKSIDGCGSGTRRR